MSSTTGRAWAAWAAAVLLTASLAAATVSGTATAAGPDGLAAAMAATGTTVTGESYLLVPPGDTNRVVTGAYGPWFPVDGSTSALLSTASSQDAQVRCDTVLTDPNAQPDPSATPAPCVEPTAGRGDTANDVTILKLDVAVPPTANCLAFTFQFLSDEYPEYVGSEFNDAFVAELDRSTWTTSGSTISAPDNFAFDAAGDVVSINSTGAAGVTVEDAADTGFDGATGRLTAATSVTPGAHSLYLSIFDQGDTVLESGVLLDRLVVGTASRGGCVSGAQEQLYALALDDVAPIPAGSTAVIPATVTTASTTAGGSLGQLSLLWSVTGANKASGATFTDSTGRSSFSYPAANTGTDVARACLDSNNDAACDFAEPAQQTSVSVVDVPAPVPAAPTPDPTAAPTAQPTVAPTPSATVTASPPSPSALPPPSTQPSPVATPTRSATPSPSATPAVISGTTSPAPATAPVPTPSPSDEPDAAALRDPTPSPSPVVLPFVTGPTPQAGAATGPPAPAGGSAATTPQAAPSTEKPAHRTPSGRSGFAASVPGIHDISTSPRDLGKSALLAGWLVLLLVFPSMLFEKTYEENRDDIRRWMVMPAGIRRWLDARRDRPRRTSYLAFVGAGALLYSLLDPGFGWNRGTLTTYTGLLVGLLAVVALLEAAALLHVRRLTGVRGRLQGAPGALALAIPMVLLSRVLDFQPGYVYGVVAAATFGVAISERDEGRGEAFAAAWALLIASAAWLVWQPVKVAAEAGSSFGVYVLDASLAAVAVAGIEALAFGLVPLRFLPGSKVKAWNRGAWLVLLFAGWFAVVHVLLDPSKGVTGQAQASQNRVLALFGSFAVLSVLFWAGFRIRAAVLDRRTEPVSVPAQRQPVDADAGVRTTSDA
jgi:hypothetical protein